mgnify:CR=1 FL=1
MNQLQPGLSFGQKAGWGLADMGIVVFVIVKQLLVMAFLTTYLGVPVQLAGAVTTLVLIFDMVTDPLIGYLSDRTSTRWALGLWCSRAAPLVFSVFRWGFPPRVIYFGSQHFLCWPPSGLPWLQFPMAPWPEKSRKAHKSALQ